MTDFEKRLRNDLEPILVTSDPREKISAYHDMPYALFRYAPDQEYPLRRELTMPPFLARKDCGLAFVGFAIASASEWFVDMGEA
jgi:hypothetical protein